MPSVTVTARGPLLEGKGPGAIKEAIHEAVKDVTAEGERRVKLQLHSGHGVLTGHYRRSIHGEMQNSMHGRIHDSKVVYGPWLEGISSRNAKSRFKGYAMFRNAKQQLEKLKAGIVNNRIAQAVRRLGG